MRLLVNTSNLMPILLFSRKLNHTVQSEKSNTSSNDADNN